MDFGQLLSKFRRRERLSQAALSGLSTVSQRHISFLESGRAAVGKEALEKLAYALNLTFSDTNELYIAAGFAPPREEFDFNSSHFEIARNVLKMSLAKHEPYPALVTDRAGFLITCNISFDHLLAAASPEYDLWERTATGDGPNLYDLTLHPEGLLPYMKNPDEIVPHTLRRINHARMDNKKAGKVARRAWRYPVAKYYEQDGNIDLAGVICERYLIQNVQLDLISMTTFFGAPEDVTSQEVQIESFFPANKETENALAQLAA